jgi:D-alanyl-lipoteichoic acid acyltransferase DltB (MBOAT superfamily)
MLFNSFVFLLVFLPAALVLMRLVDPFPSWRIATMVALSLAFYGYWDARFLALLVPSILINWLAARAYLATQRGAIIAAAIVANLATLALFKYTNFFADNLGWLIGRPLPHFDIALPLGISFFTFHHVMYLVDLRRGKAPAYPLGRYALYIAFFPQAIAGPLARWSDVMHQFGAALYEPGWPRRFALGLTFIVAGLIEKTFLADPIAQLIDPIYAQALDGPITDGRSWLALGFALQLLFDFAGYSDIAIGLALLFGVRLPFNFDAPYRATNIQDFWQRWHMTLMMFLRDYVFVPLAGARILPRRLRLQQHFAAMLLTMALCGLWHGASWNYVLWGVLQGLALVFVAQWRRYGPRLPPLAGWALTVAFIFVTDVLFRAGSVGATWNVLQGLVVLPGSEQALRAFPILVAALCAFLLPASQDIIARLTARPRPALAAALALATVAALVALGDRDSYEFIYFQF